LALADYWAWAKTATIMATLKERNALEAKRGNNYVKMRVGQLENHGR
jgi:hypothetical protein